MAEDRVWSMVLNSLGNLEKKLDTIAQDVAAMRQASHDVVRRTERNEEDIEQLQNLTASHATVLDRHDRQLAIIMRIVLAVILAVIATLVPQVLRWLPSIM